ncbi:MAG TPA: HAD family acid phosphatase [Rudaea sp.]|jgi:acid phosphatase|uniref:5'-nucleotidase, lipoprotein e(P4) family n=1 Tax=Rudaea sp. TaxID=2136325 RepID=UPI002F92D03A
MRPFVSLPILACLLVGCATTSPKPATPVAEPPPAAVTPKTPGADDDLNALAWAQTAIEHNLIYREVYRNAQEKLLRALKDPRWDALAKDDRNGTLKGLKPAVILDIDETVLDNSPYQARLLRSGNEFDEFSWAQWCKEKSAKPLPGALEFTRFAAQHGVTLFYLSNRARDLNAATVANLGSAGFPLNAGDDSFLGLGTLLKGCEQVGSNKGCRRKLIAQHYRVLMQFGDQLGDFVDAVVPTRSGRADAVAPYLDWIGERWFVLPNPTYGSWESVLFGDEWSKPREQRRQEKINALRVE